MTFRDSDSCLQKNINDLHPVNDTPEPNSFSRRKFLVSGLLAGACAALPKSALAADASSSSKTAVDPQGPADYTIRIGAGLVELADDRILSTTTYNGQFPGPLLRLKEGRPVTVDIYNDTDTPEQLHWHGQFLPVDADGAAEEGTPYIPAHGMRRDIYARPGGFSVLSYPSHSKQ